MKKLLFITLCFLSNTMVAGEQKEEALPEVNRADYNERKLSTSQQFSLLYPLVKQDQDQPHQHCEILHGHTGTVFPVAFSRDGTALASGSADRTIRVWDVATKRAIRILIEHVGWVYSVAFSPDGSMIASGSDDKTIRLWNPTAQREVSLFCEARESSVLQGHTRAVCSVAFSPDGRILASGSADETIRLWDVEQQKMAGTLSGHEGSVFSVAFSPDGKILASASSDGTVRLSDPRTQQEASVWIRPAKKRAMSVACSPDGNIIASSDGAMYLGFGKDEMVRLWDPRAQQEVAVLQGHTDSINSVAFSPNGRMLASGSDDNTVRVWDIRKKMATTVIKHTDGVYSVAFSPDGKILASGSDDKTVRLWE